METFDIYVVEVKWHFDSYDDFTSWFSNGGKWISQRLFKWGATDDQLIRAIYPSKGGANAALNRIERWGMKKPGLVTARVLHIRVGEPGVPGETTTHVMRVLNPVESS